MAGIFLLCQSPFGLNEKGGGNKVLSNQLIREQLSEYLRQHGVKHKHIAKHAGLSDTTICLFLQGQRELPEEKLRTIQSLIKNGLN